MSKIKQVIVMRNDLGARKGKLCAQAAHAAMLWLTQRLQTFEPDSDFVHEDERRPVKLYGFLTPDERDWFTNFKTGMAKIVLQIDSEQELLDLYKAALEAGLEAHIVTDAGMTEFKEPTRTCVAIGPDRADKIDKLTSELKLY